MLACPVRPPHRASLTFKMAVIWFTDNFFYDYWPQKSSSLTTFLKNPNSSHTNANGVWCSLVQEKIAQVFEFFCQL
jgi:hypothetical protein